MQLTKDNFFCILIFKKHLPSCLYLHPMLLPQNLNSLVFPHKQNTAGWNGLQARIKVNVVWQQIGKNIWNYFIA